MDEIDFGGEKYIASKKAAKMVSYTNDYVGQLCREGRVKCRRIGREWYVNENSLLEHKKNNQSKKKKSSTTPQNNEENISKKNESSAIKAMGDFYYKRDNKPLYPEPKKSEGSGEYKEKSKVKLNKYDNKLSGKQEKKATPKAMDINIADNPKSKKPKKKIVENKPKRSKISRIFFVILLFIILLGGVFALAGGFVGSKIEYDSSKKNIEKSISVSGIEALLDRIGI